MRQIGRSLRSRSEIAVLQVACNVRNVNEQVAKLGLTGGGVGNSDHRGRADLNESPSARQKSNQPCRFGVIRGFSLDDPEARKRRDPHQARIAVGPDIVEGRESRVVLGAVTAPGPSGFVYSVHCGRARPIGPRR